MNGMNRLMPLQHDLCFKGAHRARLQQKAVAALYERRFQAIYVGLQLAEAASCFRGSTKVEPYQ
jgi:hypothetical protein